MTFEAHQDNAVSPKIETRSSHRLKNFWIVGIILGIFLAATNPFIYYGVIGMFIFSRLTPLFLKIPVDLSRNLSRCGGEECWGVMILSGSILFLVFTPLAVAFLGYLYNFKSYPNTIKKYTILVFAILFILFNVLTGALERQSYINRDFLDYSIYSKSYSSIDECKNKSKVNAGACYAFFASAQDDISSCFKDELSGEIMDTSIGLTLEQGECVIAYSVYKKNPEFCSKIFHENSKQRCLATVYTAKNESKNCDILTYDFYRKRCEASTGWNLSMRPLVQWYELAQKTINNLLAP